VPSLNRTIFQKEERKRLGHTQLLNYLITNFFKLQYQIIIVDWLYHVVHQ